ncbi:Zn-dependent hydrolase [Dokdonia pacifica]|uniref:N-carbamoyl-L-amino-acid hydrolase n=1 Tax=Dokdonia pacifica TaxID=1627892 RepID=A0A238Z997_9FLAO|nr:Zn-dependent hydrolase [Dokdonia pacifica]SNR79870.1 N-carbamoyl-L-amino-acid hydrolase [Dokdonia pacifica]
MKTTLSFFSFFLILSITYAQTPKVNQDRLEKSIFELAEFGKKENGETSRVAFSQADIESRTYLIALMKDVGLEVSIDYAGNIIGRKAGSDPSKKPIAFGSHTDTVPDGGNYDGCVGSMAAIEVVKTLQDNNITTQHPLELIIFSNEEGGVMGSRALAGELPADALTIINSTGISMGDGIKVLGGDPTKLKEVIRKKGSLAAFLELHIEQGGILDQEQVNIGVVEGIVGLNWWDVTIEGFANHAGTTPMNARQDALLTAAQFIIAVNETTNSFEGKQVGTVGRINAAPGAPNVIPGKVTLSLEIRDLSAKKIKEVYAAIEKRGQEIAKETNTKITFTALSTTGKPALTDTRIQQQIAKATKALGLSQIQMQSGAGHDAQDMALIAPTGMIFVPSKNGISHSPKEYTSAEDMANGANVLLQTILLLDQE